MALLSRQIRRESPEKLFHATRQAKVNDALGCTRRRLLQPGDKSGMFRGSRTQVQLGFILPSSG